MSGRGLRWLGVTGLVLVAGMAVFAPWLAPHDPGHPSGPPFAPPSAAHWLGTNDIGQDILSELVWGSRVSLAIGLAAALVGTALGTLVGVVAGYERGRVDAVLMRVTDLVLMMPLLPLMIVLAAFIGPNLGILAGVMGLLMWAAPARILRAAVLSVGEADFVTGALALGAGRGQVLVRHVAPALLALIGAEFVQLLGRAILLEASLSFLGLGDPLRKSWGSMLYYAQARGAVLSGAWVWWVLPPGLLTAATLLAAAAIAFRIEPAVNPRVRT
jgi:peptide/nickel transport system ATP-binding protein/peptide/nickel transport system permease protein